MAVRRSARKLDCRTAIALDVGTVGSSYVHPTWQASDFRFLVLQKELFVIARWQVWACTSLSARRLLPARRGPYATRRAPSSKVAYTFFYKLRILSRCQGHFCSF